MVLPIRVKFHAHSKHYSFFEKLNIFVPENQFYQVQNKAEN